MQATKVPKKSDAEIQKQVLQELKWDPRVDETEVGVQVADGVVTLSGKISSYGKRLAAAKAAHRVIGVLDVANDLEVVVPGRDHRSDTDIAQAVRNALHWNVFVPSERITSTVSNGWVTLEGEVPAWHDKDAAARAVRDLSGVRGVTNQLRVLAPKVDSLRIRDSIEEALERQAEREAGRIQIRVDEGVVTLSGKVRSWAERNAVERAATFSKGVVRVEDRLTVDKYS
jgi:osmotically-inducible protein OsmY